MDLSGVDIKPADGYVAVQFIDDDDDDDDKPDMGGAYGATPQPPHVEESYNEACLALVIGVGAKVTNAKKGQVAILRPYARSSSVCLGEGMHLVEAYQIVGTVAS